MTENFLSECVAGVLNADPGFARAFVRRLNQGRDRLSGVSIAKAKIRAIPQFSCLSKNRRCFVDIRISVGDRVRIGVETKLKAPEGEHPSGDRQLVKYLAVPELTHIAFITDYAANVERAILNARLRYLHPPGKRKHFIWSDIYPDVLVAARRRTAPYLAQSLLELFHERHLEPIHPDLPDLATVSGRADFRPFWKDTSSLLSQWYEKVAPPRINATMYAWNNDGSGGAWKLALEPAAYSGLLRIWMYMESSTAQRKAVKALDRLFADRARPFHGATAEPRSGATSPGISIFLPYRSIFPRRSSVIGKQKRLASIIETLLETLP